MKTVSDFEPFVLAYVPYLPQEIIQHAIRESIVEFMRETKIARDTLEVETQEKVPDYIMEMPDCRRIVKIHAVDSSPIHSNGRENWQRLRSGDYSEYEIELRRGDHPIIVLQDPPKKLESIRDEKTKESEHYYHKHHILSFAITFLQISIAIASISAMTRSRPF